MAVVAVLGVKVKDVCFLVCTERFFVMRLYYFLRLMTSFY